MTLSRERQGILRLSWPLQTLGHDRFQPGPPVAKSGSTASSAFRRWMATPAPQYFVRAEWRRKHAGCKSLYLSCAATVDVERHPRTRRNVVEPVCFSCGGRGCSAEQVELERVSSSFGRRGCSQRCSVECRRIPAGAFLIPLSRVQRAGAVEQVCLSLAGVGAVQANAPVLRVCFFPRVKKGEARQCQDLIVQA